MTHFLFIGIVIIAEIVLAFLFAVIAQVFYKKSGIDFKSLFKGMIERAFLFVALVNNFPHALTLFGALKVATRLKRSSPNPEEEDDFNNFYLLGNFISVTVAIGYVYFYQRFFP